ncbi:MAG: rRNA maturation RNase YbeY [Clostridia bacterium]|nr:rRNA maturation RNase YbeY [Clostridia bacterium]
MRKNGHDIFIKNEQEIIEVTPELKKLMVSAVAESLKYEEFPDKCEVSITLVDNEEIHLLNREYRGVDRPTDVLSFPIFDEDDMGGKTILGDIVLSLERATEQAEEFGHSFEREVAFLTVHSMLHLLGYDHEEGKAAESEMFSRQEAILLKMGLARNV